MADSGINIALDPETSKHLAELSEFAKQPAQELAERLFREAVGLKWKTFWYLKFLMSVILKV